MFSDESLGAIDIQSHAKEEIYIRDQLCQTKPMKREEKSCQAITRHSAEVQTDLEQELPQSTRMCIDNSKQLTNFMLGVYPIMSEQLIANMRSHCFDGYEVDWEDTTDNEEISCIHSLRNSKNSELKVTSLTWNSTGSVIAASLGTFDHESWCIHQSFIYVWNIDRSNIDEETPYKLIDSDTCLMDICFHSSQPGLLAGGNFAGKLFIWDMSIKDNMLVAYSGKDTKSHHESISKVLWRSSAKLRTHELITVSYDACMFVWEFNQINKELLLINKYLLQSNSISRNFKHQGTKKDVEIGISCIDFDYSNHDIVYVGCENGGVFKCTLDANKSRKFKNRDKETYLLPQTKTFDGHIATVNAINLSPHFKDVFLTCSSDMSIHIYNTQQVKALITIEPISEYLFSVQWSVCRPAVFYVTTSKGKMLLFDLTVNTVAASSVVKVQDENTTVQSVAGNTCQKNIVATGDEGGVVKLWLLPFQLTQEKCNERRYFDKVEETE